MDALCKSQLRRFGHSNDLSDLSNLVNSAPLKRVRIKAIRIRTGAWKVGGQTYINRFECASTTIKQGAVRSGSLSHIVNIPDIANQLAHG